MGQLISSAIDISNIGAAVKSGILIAAIAASILFAMIIITLVLVVLNYINIETLTRNQAPGLVRGTTS